MGQTIDRRQFLRSSLVGAAATVAAGAAVATGACSRDQAADDPQHFARPELLAVLGADAVRVLGNRYREITSTENDPARLRAAITASLVSPQTTIEQQVSADFAAGRTVLLNGWLLSVTEARQCALFSLRT